MKHKIDDLAIWGGAPAFEKKLHVGLPNIGDRERLLERIGDILDRRWLTNNGLYVQELERRLAEFLGVRHCIPICNGTVALEIAIRALGLQGEVIIPSFTFVATAHALQWQEITPVFCDVEPHTHNIDPQQVERMITPRTTGIIGVHVWGRPCDVEALAAVAEKRNLRLLFDAAHAFGCSHQGQMIGRFGAAEIFSFHATKFFNTFEGGAIATNDDELAARIRLMKNFGFSGYDNVVHVGTNGKMSEISAAMGLTILECMDEIVLANRDRYRTYRHRLSQIPGVCLIPYDEREECNYQYVVLEIDEDVAQISRDDLVAILNAENVLCRRYFYPGCHQMEPYRSLFPHSGLLLPHTEQLVTRVMSLPTGPGIAREEIDQICQILHMVVSNGAAVRNRLAEARNGRA